MKKITFPHLGNLKIPMKALFQEVGLEVVVPPDNSKKTLNLGVKHAPEHACLPLKITLGNFIEALDKGANVIIMAGGRGPCRLGYYSEVQREVLKNLDYDFEMCSLEPNIKKVYHNLKYLFEGISWKKVFNGFRLAFKKMFAIDKINQVVAKNRAREKEEGIINKLFEEFLTKIDRASSVRKIKKIKDTYLDSIKDSTGEFKRQIEIKLGLVGEIYMVIEPFANLEVEKKLGELGATIERELYLSNWFLHFIKFSSDKKLKKLAEPYLKNFVGGHGIHTVGNTVKYARKNFDGVIQIGPFTFMPEMVANTVLSEVEKKEDVSTLTFFMDEQRGEAGFKTRLEAYVDLLARKKRALGKEL